MTMSFPASKEKNPKIPPISPATTKRDKLNLLHTKVGSKTALSNASNYFKSFDEEITRRHLTASDSNLIKDAQTPYSSASSLYRKAQIYEEYCQNNSATNEEIIFLLSQQLQKGDQKLDKAKKQISSYEERLSNKDTQIGVLKDEVSKLQKQLTEEREKKLCHCAMSGIPYEDLLNKCQSLEKQLVAMKEFLADYGMTWVGEERVCIRSTEDIPPTEGILTLNQMNESMWDQEKSLVTLGHKINFDLFLQNINDLNIVAGEGEAQMCYTNHGATFKRTVPSVALDIYWDGLVLSSGLFRKYSDPETWPIVQDILDGYFPHELQKDYPDGVVFQVTDNRDTPYESTRAKWEIFSGKGYRLGSKTSPQDVTSM